MRTVSGSPAVVEHLHYVRAGGQTIALVKRVTGTTETRYVHRDHLGSVVALTSATGAVLERYSYDPWGKRRDATTWAAQAPGTFAIDPSFADRGYTGHEHIDHMGLVNMNGRIYDPELGKFLSADPTTQFPESTQGWNRYSYCGNNPLSFVDPSGFSFWKSVLKIVGIAMSVFAPQFTVLWQQMLWSFASGYLSSGGNLQGGLMAVAFLGFGTWTAGVGSTGSASATFGTPGFNPNAGFSLSGETVGEVAATAAERSMTDKVAELVARSFVALRGNDAGSRTSSSATFAAQTSETGSFAKLYSADARPSAMTSVKKFFADHPEIAEGVGYVLIVVDIANTLVSPTPDVGILGAGMIAGARTAKAARAVVPSSRSLGRALEAAGHVRPPGSAAHHIVAGNAARAAPARAVLDRFGIGINDAANGAFLPGNVHSRIHKNAYYEAVNSALSQATTRQEALQVLDALRRGLP